MDFSNLYPVQIFCPNCGQRLTGYKSEDGAVRIDCPRCKVKIFSKQKGRKKVNMELTVPEEDS